MNSRFFEPAMLFLAVALAACDPAAAVHSDPPPAARVEPAGGETAVAAITLTPEAERRLEIPTHLANVERRALPRTRRYGGEAVVPPGASVAIAAPFAASIELPRGGRAPASGLAVRKGETVLALAPLLTPAEALRRSEALADAEGQVARAGAEHDAAALRFRRVEALARERAASERALEEARAQVDIARATLDAARLRRDALLAFTRTPGERDGAPTATPSAAVPVPAPIDGVVRDLKVAPGMVVPGGAPLFTIERLDPIWVRVPVPVTELDDVDREAAAQVGRPGGARTGRTAAAAPAHAAPPTASAPAGTVDLYYELANADAALRPGERLDATLALVGAAESLVLPWAAVLHDIDGATWVYEATGPQRFVRRRVHVERVAGDLALLGPEAGIAPGTQVVTAGAAELFGIELGGGR